MNGRRLSYLVGMLVVVFSAMGGAEEKESVLSREDVRGILEAGGTARSLPAGVFVRVQAHLWRSGNGGPNSKKALRETWEFTADRVHRVVSDPPVKSGDRTVYRRVASMPFDSSGICQQLLDGRILTIGDDEEGKPLQFAGTDYNLGHRSIEVFVNGKSVLDVGEACTIAGYAERDARDFAALYEKLATKARAAFTH